ncbi:ABC transporter substrate-binding protein [Aliidiomarina shirensis]|uniref:ABC transporter substrate-binding protein n=1 Tax=Aliidiomarina shirensis TaxID=1048642 RepID=A0A432WWZ9_9GAMM|nr:ABC transporter substrate-binding protein [Aliidiomarina shirensis]RUO38257.1 ABC transporter substrate-binding protein [Aliidiomarina shirensis]
MNRLIKGISAGLAILGISACSPGPETEQSLNGLLYCAEGNPESFNPQLVTSGTTLDMTSAQLYDRLLEFDAESQAFLGALATSWEISNDGLRYRFQLRENVQFHTTPWFQPTRFMNADDIVFSFERWLKSEHPFHHVSGRGYPFFRASGLTQLIQSVTAINDHEVEIKIRQQDSSFLANLASDFAIVLSAEYGEQLLASGTAELIDTQPIGTGPFQFSQFRKDVMVRYIRHSGYWREPSASAQLVFRIAQSDHKRMLMLLTQDCDISPYPPARDIQWLRDKPEITLQDTISPNTAFWAFNTERPPFDDPLVRQALAHAVNRNAILNTVYFDHAVRADSILPNTSWAHHGTPSAYRYDPERARELLAEAGYPNGFSMQIWALPVQRAYNPNARLMAERIQADLNAIGVQAGIVSYEWSTFRRRLADGEHDSVLIGWSADHADPDNFFRPLLSCAAKRSGNNRAQWCDPMFDELLSAAISSNDQDVRKAYYEQAQDHLAREVPLLPIAHSVRFQAARQNIQGLELEPFGGIQLRNVSRQQPAVEEQ